MKKTTVKFEQQAINMTLGQLNTNSVLSPRVIELMIDVPREDFVPKAQRKSAYIDQNIEIGAERYMLAPLTFSKLLELADVTPSCRALVIGCDNGYATAVIAELAGHVVSIDSDSSLVAQAMDNLKRLKIKDIDIKHVANMSFGYQLSAPYDVIFVNGGVEQIPEFLSSQLAIGGKLVAIRTLAKGLGRGILLQKYAGQPNIREYFDAYVPVLKGFELSKKFAL